MKLQSEFRKMTNKRRRERHIELHRALDELAAAWAVRQPPGKVFSNSTIMELIQWSFKQTQEPDD
ncbi:MAG TPA: hypothetical protein VNW90_19290 [Acetobacteraceae bacterium]|jgi:hypothetical protein|nr:hypothetical protein [Acetobacteraceae bacterium]